MNTEKIIESINKSGFVLEYEVGLLFEENGWSVINNRYYLDDDSDKSREIDIIAYKVREVEGTFYYTTLIISCKKSNDEIWTFLVKDLNEEDPNIEKYPITDWSNNPIIDFMKEKQVFKDKVIEGIKYNDNVRFSYEVGEQVFAFQQLNNKSYKLRNDRDIYNSIITSIKALEYERKTLDSRINRDALYNFNVLSVFDGDMLSLKYEGNSEPVVKETKSIKYLNRHIINKVDSFFRVHFINYDSLKEYLNYYDGLHDWHVKAYSELKVEYENLIMNDHNESALELLLDEFKKEIYWNLYINEMGQHVKVDCLDFDKDKILRVNCDIKDGSHDEVEESVQYLNNNDGIKKEVKEALVKVYGYKGKFYFNNGGLPF